MADRHRGACCGLAKIEDTLLDKNLTSRLTNISLQAFG